MNIIEYKGTEEETKPMKRCGNCNTLNKSLYDAEFDRGDGFPVKGNLCKACVMSFCLNDVFKFALKELDELEDKITNLRACFLQARELMIKVSDDDAGSLTILKLDKED